MTVIYWALTDWFSFYRSIKARDVFFDDHTHDAKLYRSMQIYG